MSTGLVALLAFNVVAWWLSGARSLVYLAYYLAFAPFVTLDLSDGGMQTADDLGSGLVLVKMGARLATTALVLFLLVRRPVALWALGNRRTLPAVFLIGWSVLGLIGVDEPLVPLLRLGELCSFVLLGAALWGQSDDDVSLRTRLRWHALALLPLVGITLFYAATQPALALHVDPDGMVRMGNRLINAETLGTIGALLSLWATYEVSRPRERDHGWMRERGLPLACLALAVLVLLFARSRTAMIGAAVGQAILWSPLFGATRRQWMSSAAFFLVALIVLASQAEHVESWFLRGDTVANLRSGTGRTELWAHLIEDSVPLHPLLGNGYLNLGEKGGFWHAGHQWTNAHNAYLAALLFGGLPALAAVLALVLLPITIAWRRARSFDGGAWTLILALFVFAAISSVTSFGICGWPNPLMLFFYALYPLVVIGARREIESEAADPAEDGDEARDAELASDDDEEASAEFGRA